MTVVNPPKHSPPAVSIKKPGQDAYLLPGKTHTLDAIAVDPDACVFLTCNANGMKYLWKVRLANGTEKVIGHQKLISWKPQDDVPQGCGTKPVDLIFKATDAEGMSATDTVDVTIGFPPC